MEFQITLWSAGVYIKYSIEFRPVRFTWDDNKYQANFIKHGFDFADAETVFNGPTFTYEDDRFAYGEQRLMTLGLLGQVVVSVTHTELNGEIRVISMRRGSKNEQRIFFKNIENWLGKD